MKDEEIGHVAQSPWKEDTLHLIRQTSPSGVVSIEIWQDDVRIWVDSLYLPEFIELLQTIKGET